MFINNELFQQNESNIKMKHTWLIFRKKNPSIVCIYDKVAMVTYICVLIRNMFMNKRYIDKQLVNWFGRAHVLFNYFSHKFSTSKFRWWFCVICWWEKDYFFNNHTLRLMWDSMWPFYFILFTNIYRRKKKLINKS